MPPMAICVLSRETQALKSERLDEQVGQNTSDIGLWIENWRRRVLHMIINNSVVSSRLNIISGDNRL